MPMPSSHIKERLSVAYVNLVAARAGATCIDLSGGQDYGSDMEIHAVKQLPSGKFLSTGYLFHCQLKATTTSVLKDDAVIYDMDVEAYNKLVQWEGGSVCLLVIFRLPENEADWLEMNEEQLLLRHCCYWKHITGPLSTNRSTQSVFIPRSNLFNAEAVTEILDMVRRGDFKNGYTTG